MNFRLAVITLAFMCSTALAQTAKVVELSKEDATRARVAYEAKQKADSEWAEVQRGIQEKYVSDKVESTGITSILGSGSTMTLGLSTSTVEINPCEGSIGSERIDLSDTLPCIAYRRSKSERAAKTPKQYTYQPKVGWFGGFEFSEEFRFITPKPVVVPTRPASAGWYGLNTLVNNTVQ